MDTTEQMRRVREAEEAVTHAREQVAEAVERRAAVLREVNRAGVPWSQIGRELGVTYQRAQQMSRQGRDQQPPHD